MTIAAIEQDKEFEALMATVENDKNFDLQRSMNAPRKTLHYTIQFVEWISSLGFHIEITGDEFDLALPSSLAA